MIFLVKLEAEQLLKGLLKLNPNLLKLFGKIEKLQASFLPPSEPLESLEPDLDNIPF